MNKNKNGFGYIVLLLVLVLVIIVTLIGWRVYRVKSGRGNFAGKSSSGQSATWQQTEDGWTYKGTLPDCPTSFPPPVDMIQVTSILYPGQYRGGEYKAHGGFRFDNATNNNVNITAPFDAELVRGAHYSVSGDPQYALDFISPCGYMYRLGHLLTLSPKLQEIAAKLPVNAEGDSRDSAVQPRVQFKAGEIIATATGITKNGSGPGGINVFVDWGVYDLRAKNKSSEDAAWAAKHPSDIEQHALCWFDLLSDENEAKVRALPPSDGQSGSTSDYCR